MVPYSTIKELHFVFKQKLSGMNFFLTPRGMIPWGVSFFQRKFEELSENLTKIENIFTHWSVAQAGSNYEKN